jgi:hypothetical protein
MDPKWAERGALDSIGRCSLTGIPESSMKRVRTSHDTNDLLSGEVRAYVIEGMVGTRRLELLTSTVSIYLNHVQSWS